MESPCNVLLRMYAPQSEALKNGLKLDQELGINPFKFGLVGGTDQHIGLTASEEENYFGVSPMDEPKPGRAEGVFSKLGDTKVMIWEMGYDAKRFGVKMPKEIPMTLQERGYTSPIWYTPAVASR